MKINGSMDFSSCSCFNDNPKINSCSVQKDIDFDTNGRVTFNIQYQISSFQNSPYCILNDDKNREISKIAVLGIFLFFFFFKKY